MTKGKAADPIGIVPDMCIAEEDYSLERSTSLCNLIAAHGRISDDWRNMVIPCQINKCFQYDHLSSMKFSKK